MLISIPIFFLRVQPYEKLHRIVFFILISVTLLEFFGTYSSNKGISNLVAYNLVFVYLESLMFLYFFKNIFNEKKTSKWLSIGATVFILWGTSNSILFQPLNTFQNNSFLVGSLLVIGCCFYFFYGIIKKDWYSDQNLFALPVFWIVTIVMFFYTCSFLFFASIGMVNEHNIDLMFKINQIIQALSTLMYLTMGLAFYIPFWFKHQNIYR